MKGWCGAIIHYPEDNISRITLKNVKKILSNNKTTVHKVKYRVPPVTE